MKGAPTMLIRNYGLFWDKDLVDWGRGRKLGSLRGIPARAKREESVDFRKQIGVYALYDTGFNLLYIGQIGTRGLYTRLNEHRTGNLSQRWKYFSWFGLYWVKKTKELSGELDSRQVVVSSAIDQIEAVSVAISE